MERQIMRYENENVIHSGHNNRGPWCIGMRGLWCSVACTVQIYRRVVNIMVEKKSQTRTPVIPNMINMPRPAMASHEIPKRAVIILE